MSSRQRENEKRRERREQEIREDEERSRAAHEKNERYRYLPASERSFDDLAESIGQEEAQLIRDLIRDMIQEAKGSYNGG